MSASVQTVESQILRAIAEQTAVRIAEQIGISPSRFSDSKGDLVERAAKLIVACGFRLVPAHEPQYDPEHIAILEKTAQHYWRLRQRDVA